MNNLIIENARIIFKNFSGVPGKYNKDGRRSFNVVIEDQDTALNLKAQGYNIKPLPPKDPQDDLVYILKVTVEFNSKNPPKVYKISGDGSRVSLGAESVSCLDYVTIKSADLNINPWDYSRNVPIKDGEPWISAYLNSGYFVVDEDPLEAKYASFAIDEEAF